MYDLIILGGGPAGSAASIYSARKQIKTALITPEFGGQSMVSEKIYNWIGTPEISGLDLALSFKKHAHYYKGEFLDIFENEKVLQIKKEDNWFTIKTDRENEYRSKAILISTGSGRKKIEALNADKFEHKGITYCASCDGPLFQDQDVVVVGGGNSAFETASQLIAYCKSVTLIHRNETFKADEITIEKLKKNPKLTIITNAEILSINGNDFVESLTYKDKTTSEEKEILTTGIFVEIGQAPNTDFVKDIVDIDERGKIIVNPSTQETNTPGIWAAGDCTNAIYHQNNIAVGDGVKAVEDAYLWIHRNK
jgi:alkyl hydroperoxide reductase subunit F